MSTNRYITYGILESIMLAVSLLIIFTGRIDILNFKLSGAGWLILILIIRALSMLLYLTRRHSYGKYKPILIRYFLSGVKNKIRFRLRIIVVSLVFLGTLITLPFNYTSYTYELICDDNQIVRIGASFETERFSFYFIDESGKKCCN